MPSTYSNLKIQLMATGENNTTWGDVTNTNLGTAIEEAIAGSAIVTFADADVTLTLTDSNASQTARNLRLSLTGTVTANRNLIVPSIEKAYIINNGLTFTIGVKNATGSTVSVPAGKTMWVYNNGSNVVDAVTHLTSLSVGAGMDITGASTITVNSSSDALRITQTGAGNALIVEDSANPDTSPFAIDANGNALLGDLTAYTVGNPPKMQISSTGSGGSSINVITWSAASAATSPTYNFARSRGATAGSYAAVTSGDFLGGLSFYGSDGASFQRGAIITAATDGAPATGFVPGRITFSTGTNAAAPVERMRISSGGFVGINTISPTQALSVSGGVGYNAPVTVAAATYTVAITDNWIIANNAGTVTLTLPAAASFSGRILTVKNVQAQLVISASSNVVPIGSTTAGTAILAATAGKFATVVSDGTNWVVMQAN